YWARASRWPRLSATCSSLSSSERRAPRTPAASSAPTAGRSTVSTRSCSPLWPATTSGLRTCRCPPRTGRSGASRCVPGLSHRLPVEHEQRTCDEFELVGLSAERSWQTLVEQARAHGVKRIALADGDQAARAAEAWCDGEVLGGAEGLVRLVVESQADLVLNALVGSAGLGPTVAALGEGIDLALANKESLVVGGELVVALAQATGAQIVPVDSEHTALHQL